MIDFLLGVPGKLKTIYDYLTTHLSSTRAAKIDNLDAAMSTRAPASTALSTATWTGTKAGYLDAGISTRLGGIKSIQTGQITIQSTDGSASATIAAVNTAKTILLNLGSRPLGTVDSYADVAQCFVDVSLSNSTTVTAANKSQSSGGVIVIVRYMVIEFL